MEDSANGCSHLYGDTFKYALDNGLIINEYAKRVSARLRGGSLLELGIGHGISTEIFNRSAARHVVIEGDAEIIRRFKEKNSAPGAKIIESLFENFEDAGKFDNIIMGFVLEHVADPDFILAKYKKFLNAGGRVFVAAPNSEALNRRLGFEAGLLEDIEWMSEAHKALGHKRYFNLKKLEELARRNGMAVVSTEGLFLKPITTDQIKQLNLSGEILGAMMKVGTGYPELCAAILMELRDE